MNLPTIPFRLERQMLAPLGNALPTLLKIAPARTVRILREPVVGNVIPDLLLGSWEPASRPLSYAATTFVDAHIRALIEREGPLTEAEMRRRLHLSEYGAAMAQARLIRHGVLIEMPSELGGNRVARDAISRRWMLAPEASTSLIEIIAVEAKLTRWRDAVSQAATYLAFADRAVVVLDGNQIGSTVSLVDAVQAARVGLVLQHGQVVREVIPAPLHASPATPARVQALTKLVTERGGRAFRVVRGNQPSRAQSDHMSSLTPLTTG